MNKMVGFLQEATTAYPSRAHGFTPGLVGSELISFSVLCVCGFLLLLLVFSVVVVFLFFFVFVPVLCLV